MSKSNKWDEDTSTIYHCHLNFRDIPIVYDGKIDCDREEIPKIQDPPSQLFADVDDMVFEDLTVRCRSFYNKHFNEATISEANIAYGYMLLGDSLVREMSSKELESSSFVTNFTARSSSLTTNDIKLTGVFGLVRAISTMLMINSSVDVIMAKNKEETSVGLRMLCDSLSDSFWGQFAAVIIHRPVISKLKKIAGFVNYNYNTSDVFSIIEMLKAAVCQDAYTLLELISTNDVRSMNNVLILAVPNDNAARHLLGRFYRCYIWTRCSISGMSKGDALFLSKKVIADLYRLEMCPTITSARIHLSEKMAQICMDREIDIQSTSLPTVVMLNLNEPWISKLKPSYRELVEIRSEVGLAKRRGAGVESIGVLTSYRFGPNEVCVQAGDCKCAGKGIYRSPYIDYFYLRGGGINSYSPLVLDCVTLCNLTTASVVILGDKDGDMGLMLSRLEETDKVYIAPTRSVTSYSQHTAGSCIPTAFVDSGLEKKLVDPGFTNLLGDPLLSDQSLRRVKHQVKAGKYSGLLIDYTRHDRKLQLREGRLLSVIREFVGDAPHNEWCIVVMKVACVHSLSLAISQVGAFFELVSLFASWLHRPSSNILLLIGRQRRPIPLKLSEKEAYLRVSTDSQTSSLVTIDDRDIIPPMMKQSVKVQESWLKVFEGLPSNFREYCNNYIPGWGLSYGGVLALDSILVDLKNIRGQVKKEAEHYLKIQDGIISGHPMSRNEILVIGNPRKGDKFSLITHVWIRCAILTKLLESDAGDIDKLIKLYNTLMKREYHLVLNGVNYSLPFSPSYFRRYYSNHLFGIIGHLWLTVSTAVRAGFSEMLHIKDPSRYTSKEIHHPMWIERSFVHQLKPSSKYRWDSRAKIVTMMSIASSMRELPIVSPNLDVIRSRIGHLLLERGELRNMRLDGTNIRLSWFGSSSIKEADVHMLSNQVDSDSIGKHLAVIRTIDLRQFSERFGIFNCQRVAWSGEIPGMMLVNFGYFQENLRLTEGETFDYSSHINSTYSMSTHSGCLCFDCSMETHIAESLKLTMSDVSDLCRVYKYESIDDIKHAF